LKYFKGDNYKCGMEVSVSICNLTNSFSLLWSMGPR